MTTTTCTHWFVVATPNGPTSDAVCKHCGETRVYYNAGVDSPYYEESMQKRRHAAGEAVRKAAAAKRGGAETGAQNAVFRQSLKHASASGVMK